MFVETKPQTMNYIKELQSENNEMRNTLMDIQNEIATLLIYYTSPKFQGFQNDFAHVSTDILPRVVKLRESAYIHIKREKK